VGVVMDVVVWLRSLGLEKYEAVFRENEIDDPAARMAILTITWPIAEPIAAKIVPLAGKRRAPPLL
jgi:hypothetical protein